jgi:hypothetical protein
VCVCVCVCVCVGVDDCVMYTAVDALALTVLKLALVNATELLRRRYNQTCVVIVATLLLTRVWCRYGAHSSPKSDHVGVDVRDDGDASRSEGAHTPLEC